MAAAVRLDNIGHPTEFPVVTLSCGCKTSYCGGLENFKVGMVIRCMKCEPLVPVAFCETPKRYTPAEWSKVLARKAAAGGFNV